MSLGDFVMFVFFVGLLIAPVVRLADSATQLSEAFAGLDRLRELRAGRDRGRGRRRPRAAPASQVVGDVELRRRWASSTPRGRRC